ncbi:hypothetical protein ACFQXB_10640 [Plastorhodobacter daqingensis]|uniref:DedA family protein n=1 Tax=Plastorhodobacter daqingensis TaxID=1387281 RepID=A0ABW2UM61_9RHOB
MDTYLDPFLGNPAVLFALLFLGTFVLEEAAILSGAALAAAGEMSAAVAFSALGLGMIVSDWALFAIGAAAGRSRWLRQRIGEANIARGRRLLGRGVVAAGFTARLVPWLLFPVFVASGFLGVRFVTFAGVNALIAAVYVAILFFGIYGFNLVLFEMFAGWGWLAVVACAAALFHFSRLVARRFRAREAARAAAAQRD